MAIAALSVAASVACFLAFFATLATGRYPRSLWEFMAGFHRWTHRVLAYTLMVSDRYPPFTLSEAPSDTVRLRADYPESVARWRPLFAWLLVVPYLIVASGLAAVAPFCAVLAAVNILFTRRVPDFLFDVIVNALTWQNQASFYTLWMSDRYPLWRWHRSKGA